MNKALSFVYRYPMSNLIPKDFYNDNGTIKRGRNINIIFKDFNDELYNLFKETVKYYRFVKDGECHIEPKPINYYIYNGDSYFDDNRIGPKYGYESDYMLIEPDPLYSITKSSDKNFDLLVKVLDNPNSFTMVITNDDTVIDSNNFIVLKNDITLENITFEAIIKENLKGIINGRSLNIVKPNNFRYYLEHNLENVLANILHNMFIAKSYYDGIKLLKFEDCDYINDTIEYKKDGCDARLISYEGLEKLVSFLYYADGNDNEDDLYKDSEFLKKAQIYQNYYDYLK